MTFNLKCTRRYIRRYVCENCTSTTSIYDLTSNVIVQYLRNKFRRWSYSSFFLLEILFRLRMKYDGRILLASSEPNQLLGKFFNNGRRLNYPCLKQIFLYKTTCFSKIKFHFSIFTFIIPQAEINNLLLRPRG